MTAAKNPNFILSTKLVLPPFSRWTWISRYQNVPFWILAKDDGGGGNNFTGAVTRAKLQSNQSWVIN